MPRILLVATTTGYQIRSFGEAAEELGVRLVFATDRCDQLEVAWWDQAVPIRFHDIERSTAAIVAAANGARIDGVLAVGDRPTIIAAHAAQALGLPGNHPDAARTSRNKLATRRALQRAGLPAPWFEAVGVDADARPLSRRVPYPCVVKPLALSGSRGVIRADTPGELVSAFARVAALLKQPDIRIERDAVHEAVIVESFIPGREYAVEALLHHGVLRTLAIFDKPDPLDGPFFEETIYVTPTDLSERQRDRVAAAVASAARAIGLTHGPVHAEARVNADGVFVLEVAARPIGGLCSRALRFTTVRGGGDLMSLENLLLRHAADQDVSQLTREPAASGVMMIPIPARGVYRAVAGVDEACAVAGVDDVRITAKADQLLVPLPEGKSYLGFIFAHAPTPGAVVSALRDAHARLRFTIERSVPVVASRG
jgi:biotin carboxylase